MSGVGGGDGEGEVGVHGAEWRRVEGRLQHCGPYRGTASHHSAGRPAGLSFNILLGHPCQLYTPAVHGRGRLIRYATLLQAAGKVSSAKSTFAMGPQAERCYSKQLLDDAGGVYWHCLLTAYDDRRLTE